jgi:hypothetical protein
MHPDILRELGAQRDSEMRARAQRVKLMRTARGKLWGRRGAAQVGRVVVPVIPDFVDGSLLTSAEEAADRKPRRVLTGRHAA